MIVCTSYRTCHLQVYSGGVRHYFGQNEGKCISKTIEISYKDTDRKPNRIFDQASLVDEQESTQFILEILHK